MAGLSLLLLIPILGAGQNQGGQWSYSDLVRHAQAGEVRDVTISGTSATATDRAGKQYRVSLPEETASLAGDLTAAGVDVHYDTDGGMGEQRNHSEKMASLIDDEVRRIVDDARSTAGRVLTERREALGRLASA